MGKGDKRLEEEALYKISILETTSDDTSLYNIQSIVKPLLISKDYYYRYYANYYLYAKAQEENNECEMGRYLDEMNNLSDKVPKYIKNQFYW